MYWETVGFETIILQIVTTWGSSHPLLLSQEEEESNLVSYGSYGINWDERRHKTQGHKD